MKAKAAARLAGALLIGALAGCTLPRSGPTASDLERRGSDPTFSMQTVNVTPTIAAITRVDTPLGFPSSMTGAGTVSPDTIAAGDRLAVTVWENVNTGLLAGVGQKNTPLADLQVDQAGDIYVPYAGRIRAGGLTPDQLRDRLVASLEQQTPDPQIEVRRVAGDGSTVAVMGEVAEPGVYPIEAPTRRLSAMLARAGGAKVPIEVGQVKLERGGTTGRVWLQDLYDNPVEDVALRPNDRVIVETDRRAFTALGASGRQSRVNFTQRDMSAIEAIAAAGGLDGRAADPTGVFIFREERSDIANRVLGRGDLVGAQRMAYLIDLTKPEGLFAARDFVVRDGDTIYMTEAPFAAWSRVLAVAVTAVNFTASVDNLAN
ncbi:polysaccharide biosynthesis/export family protein [Amaricoccus solimangrovi]|uniref:polysaccharide biosynthesis/export family protein n=1 Tax=Amaricoccus solimangrovi TaxID=2589815 RepID=UPI003F6739FA